MGTLYALTNAASQLYELLISGEIDEQALTDTLESMGANDKLESYCKIINQLKADIEMYSKEESRIHAHITVAKNGVERMTKALKDFMDAAQKHCMDAGTFKVTLASYQSVTVTDPDKVPALYKTPQPDKIDKVGIKKAIQAGADVPGAEITMTEGVRIR